VKEAALALLRRGDRWFLQRRDPANPVLPSLWEFPGGKIEDGETPSSALERELREEVGLVLHSARACPTLEGPVRLHPFLVQAAPDPRTELGWGWFTVAEMLRLPLPPMTVSLIARLAEDVEGGESPLLRI
jgi:8-oxo-dGTP pyrophosphatase MutT (NUDIX family)